MTLAHLARRSLTHYWRTHAAVALGVAAGVGVLAGALLVGSSVSQSLADLSTARLGRTAFVVGTDTSFGESLGGRLSEVLAGATGDDAPTLAPLFVLRGAVQHSTTGARATQVFVYGVDDRFFAFHGVSATLPDDGARLSPALTTELDAAADEFVVVRVPRPTDIPLDSLHGSRDESGRAIRLRVAGTLSPEDMGEFSLSPTQGAVRSVFVPLSRLQRDLDQAGRINTLLVASSAGDAARVRTALAAAVDLADLGLSLRQSAAMPDTTVVESASGLISDGLVSSVGVVAGRSGLPSTSVLTWLATRLTVGDRTSPYALVSAVGPAAGGDEALAGLLRGGADERPPIVLSDWAITDLGASPGDALSLEYYRWLDEGRLVTESATFEVVGAIPMRGLAADRSLAPDYPGISDARSLAEWTPPFPIDLTLVRPIDEAYWDEFRATPKAFVPLAAGQALWRTRYGAVSSVRLQRSAPPADVGASGSATARLETELRATVDPLRAGITVADVGSRNAEAAAGTTDFGAYFSYFSFFLMVSALLLTALFFRLNVEQRLTEVGLLRAAGFPIAVVRRLFLLEAAAVAGAGAAAGVVLAVLWAWLMMYGLRTWWVGAVGTTRLELHVTPLALVSGALAGAVIGWLSIALTLRSVARLTPRTLLAGGAHGEAVPRALVSRAGLLAALSAAAAVGLTVAATAGWVPPAGAFFGAGTLTLLGGLFAVRRWLTRRPTHPLVVHGGRWGLARMGLRNASWRPGRSLTAVALVAAAVFLLVSVDAFRKRASAGTGPDSGTGGFALFAESALPIVQDPSTLEGRDALGLQFSPDDPAWTGVSITPVRLRPGDDASCLNLYQPAQPRVLGVPPDFVAEGRFSFASSLATTDAERENPWRLLGPADAEGVVPVAADATSLQYALHASVGDVMTIDAGGDRPVRLRIVAALEDSMLQGELIIAEQAFLALYPETAGYRVLLVDVAGPTPERLATLTGLVEDRLEPFGVDVQDSGARLDAYHQVENTYLSTFQALGGLGLVLGVLGLSAIVARNVLERRRELALLGAAGFTGRDLQWLVLAEHLALVLLGVAIGLAGAELAIGPVLISRGSGLPTLPLAWTGLVLAAGVTASSIATRQVRRLPIVASLRNE